MILWFAATFSQLLASLRNSGRSLQKICQISTPSDVLDLSYMYSDTNLHKISMSSSITVGRHQLSHHIFFLLSQKVDTTSNPVIGGGVNVPALLWPNGDAQFIDRNSSLVLAWAHAIHSWCRPVSRKADVAYWLTAMQIMSVSLAFAIRTPSGLPPFVA